LKKEEEFVMLIICKWTIGIGKKIAVLWIIEPNKMRNTCS
jgi:hypothetical protein